MPFLITIFIGLMAMAQAQYSEQPEKESASDLRSQVVLFSIDFPQEHKTYLLERTSNQDYFLRLKEKSSERIQKVAGREAVKMDRDFSSRFLRCQYEFPSEKGECEVTLRLTMRGEKQEICHKDDKKAQEIQVFVKKLSKLF